LFNRTLILFFPINSVLLKREGGAKKRPKPSSFYGLA
jgi:hypothetical protein